MLCDMWCTTILAHSRTSCWPTTGDNKRMARNEIGQRCDNGECCVYAYLVGDSEQFACSHEVDRTGQSRKGWCDSEPKYCELHSRLQTCSTKQYHKVCKQTYRLIRGETDQRGHQLTSSSSQRSVVVSRPHRLASSENYISPRPRRGAPVKRWPNVSIFDDGSRWSLWPARSRPPERAGAPRGVVPVLLSAARRRSHHPPPDQYRGVQDNWLSVVRVDRSVTHRASGTIDVLKMIRK